MSSYDHSNGFYKSSYHVAEFFTSLPFIMLVLLMFMGYRFYEVQTLFIDMLQTRIDDPGTRTVASTLIAGVITCFTLAIMVHSEGLMESNTWVVRVVLALVGMFINLAFWLPWQSADLFASWGISIILSGIDWTLPFLFAIRWAEIVQREAPPIYKCDQCEREFQSQNGLNGHKCEGKKGPESKNAIKK